MTDRWSTSDITQHPHYQLALQERDQARAELRAETARLDWLFANTLIRIPRGPDDWKTFESREDIDAAMKERP